MPKTIQCIFCQHEFVGDDEAPGECPGCGTELLDASYVVVVGSAADQKGTAERLSSTGLEATRTVADDGPPGGLEGLSGALEPFPTMPAAGVHAAGDAAFDDVTPAALGTTTPMASPAVGGVLPGADDPFTEAEATDVNHPELVTKPTPDDPALNEAITADAIDTANLASRLPLESEAPSSGGNGVAAHGFVASEAPNLDDPNLADTGQHTAIDFEDLHVGDAADDDEMDGYVEDEHTVSSNLDLEALAAVSGSVAPERPRWRCPICSAEFPGSRPKICPACSSQLSQ